MKSSRIVARRFVRRWRLQAAETPSLSRERATRRIRSSGTGRSHLTTRLSLENCWMNLTLEEITKAVGGKLDGAASVKARGYSIDSRTINPGELFFAIKGPRFDGHSFVTQVLEKKAAGAIVEESWAAPTPAPGPLIRVRSTTEALQQLAREVRRRWGMRVIGVTGSVGKTTTKEMMS